jgi:hypothetical protein
MAVEQLAAFSQVRDDAGSHQRAEHGGQGCLVAGIDLDVVGECLRAADR